jgi:hypothetical protein
MQALPGKDAFQSCLNSVFELSFLPGQALDVRLVELRGGRPDPRIEQFSLLFQGPQNPLLPQQMYHLRQAEIGEMDLFLVPVGQDAGGTYYEAVFNRLKQEET